MKRTLMMTAAFVFGGQMAFAAIDPQALANSYLAEGYTFVEVKQGPTQTKLEAVKGATVVEVVYDNGTGAIISQETQAADADEIGRTGVQVKTTDKDFEDTDDEDDEDEEDEDEDEDDEDEDEDEDDDDEDDEDDDDEDEDEDEDDDNSGHGSDGDDD
jgi:hypothetical protein